jgi:hypothetical protein
MPQIRLKHFYSCAVLTKSPTRHTQDKRKSHQPPAAENRNTENIERGYSQGELAAFTIACAFLASSAPIL